MKGTEDITVTFADGTTSKAVVVSGLDRMAEDGDLSGLIQFDASVNPGSSGGPSSRHPMPPLRRPRSRPRSRGIATPWWRIVPSQYAR
ncbi:S1C family serine protease [Nonomuraea jiangxiensis]|uniref:Uncharacterized protein n=1 Tax=Nonomuraea jiangxiensis TaxID=633440 RepID=A0A1G8PTW3_9ACTN|nr:S1C family serine protease [Nonomuraea jiangxiensis]SDI95937.1 hypothetical protein SAMN05421869_10828 [Nonomuraea jiangxiensis]